MRQHREALEAVRGQPALQPHAHALVRGSQVAARAAGPGREAARAGLAPSARGRWFPFPWPSPARFPLRPSPLLPFQRKISR